VDLVGLFQHQKFYLIDGVLLLEEKPMKFSHHKKWSHVVNSIMDVKEEDFQLLGISCVIMD